MPDLNYDTPAVREEAKKIANFWLRDMGVDGFRLDAVPYLVEEGACLAGCAGTHAFLQSTPSTSIASRPGAYTVGEAWGSIDTLLPYYPDQLTSYFGFELADSLLSVVRTGSAAGLLPGYLRLQDTLPAYRWSPFLSNHDGTRSHDGPGRRHRPRAGRGDAAAHAPGTALRLLRRRDRHDGRQAGRASANADAVGARDGRRLHDRHAVGSRHSRTR